jgi:hypothetical protein
MTDLLTECKRGLNLPETSTVFDGVLTQKILAVKGFLSGAGVSDEQLATDLGIGLIVMGVADLWNVTGGETRFSPAFYSIATQLAFGTG